MITVRSLSPCSYVLATFEVRTRNRPPAARIAGYASLANAANFSALLVERWQITQYALGMSRRQRPRQVEALASCAIALRKQAADRPVVLFGDALGDRVDDPVARVNQQDLAHHQLALGAEFDTPLDAAFKRGRGFADAGMLDRKSTRLNSSHLVI